MAKARKPKNFFVTVQGGTNYLTWDKVLQDIAVPPNYIDTLGYYVYSTENPNGNDFQQMAFINTGDPYADKDIFYVDYVGGNKLYKVCPVTSEGIGECTISYGIISEGEITTPTSGLYDLGKWDACLWG